MASESDVIKIVFADDEVCSVAEVVAVMLVVFSVVVVVVVVGASAPEA